MQKILTLTLIVLGTFIGCESSPPQAPETPWGLYQKEFFAELWPTFPTWASSVGLRDYDHLLKVPDAAYEKQTRAFFQKYLDRLKSIPQGSLSPQDSMDMELVRNFLESGVWEMDTFKTWEWNPSQTNLGNAFASVLEAKTDDEAKKLKSVMARLAVVPTYYEAAFKRLKVPTREHTQLALKQNGGLSDYLDRDVRQRFANSKLSAEEKQKANQFIDDSIKAVKTYVQNLTALRDRLARTNGFRSFRIGKTLYAKKFEYDLQSRSSAAEIYQQALAQKKAAHTEMISLAKTLWPKYFGKKAPPKEPLVMVRQLVERVSLNHIQPNEFLPTIERQIPQLWSFVEQKKLLTLDPKKPLKVRATPPYERGFAGASIDAPGPFDPDRETYYNVTPLDDMPPAKQESYLREYNNYTLQILNIHEAIPGHYVQLVYSLKSPSLVKRVFGSGTMVEGWAVYAERMMLEEGYGNNEPELWLMYHKWRLRVICNTILDYSLHNLNMSREKALQLLTREAFQESAEAEEKWNRATYSQVQLASYFTGFTEIYQLREDLKKKQGAAFDLKTFHEKFLSYGSAPIKFIADAMMSEAP